MRVEEGFQPIPYPELHPYTDDPVIRPLLKRLIPTSIRPEIDADLVRFGNDIKDNIRTWAPLVHAPQLTQYDQWGRRIDRLDTSEGWRKLKDVAIREGLIAIPHERKYCEYSRLYSFAKIMVFIGDSHTIMCPFGMTDGAARVIELLGTDDMKRDIRSRLISRDPSVAFTGGQWMTERPGGSDVSQTETTATSLPGNAQASSGAPYSLNGFKWFSSATDCQVAIALARTGSLSLGSRSLSLFLVPLRLPLLPTPSASAISNGILVHRLKNKFGTHAVPTAELSLNDTKAYLLSPLNEGVKQIAPVLNISRIHCSISSIGSLSRALAIARSYATVRSITVPNSQGSNRVKQLLKDTPLHMSVLAKVGTTYRALTHLTFGAIALLGKSECGTSNKDEEARLRLLTPAVKAFVSDRALAAMEVCMTSLGGQGYMEECVVGRLIRDASVEKIWEGTINVLSLDMVRASQGDHVVISFMKWAHRTIASVPPSVQRDSSLHDTLNSLKLAIESLPKAFTMSATSAFVPLPLLYMFAHATAALYLLEHTVWAFCNRDMQSDWMTDANVFKRWVEDGLDAARNELERVGKLSDRGGRYREDLAIVYRGDASFNQTKL